MSLLTITALVYSGYCIALFLVGTLFIPMISSLGERPWQGVLTEMLESSAPVILSPILLAVVGELCYRVFRKWRADDAWIKVRVPKRQIVGQVGLAMWLLNTVVSYDNKGIVLLLFLIVMGSAVFFRHRMKMGFPFWFVNVCCAAVIGLSVPISLALSSWVTTETIYDLKTMLACMIFGICAYLNYRYSFKNQT